MVLGAGRWPVAGVGARPLRGTSACYRDRRDHRDHRDGAWEVLRTGNRCTGTTRILRVAFAVHGRTFDVHWQSSYSLRNGRDARCPSAFGQANGLVRKPGLPFPGGLGGPGGPGPPTGKWHSQRAARQLPAAIPSGRPANFQRQFHAGGPPTSSGTPIMASSRQKQLFSFFFIYPLAGPRGI